MLPPLPPTPPGLDGWMVQTWDILAWLARMLTMIEGPNPGPTGRLQSWNPATLADKLAGWQGLFGQNVIRD